MGVTNLFAIDDNEIMRGRNKQCLSATSTCAMRVLFPKNEARTHTFFEHVKVHPTMKRLKDKRSLFHRTSGTLPIRLMGYCVMV